jgi:RIO kinase 1
LGDERGAAGRLPDTGLPRGAADPLFQETLRNIELLLEHNLIHGDLSAYNILYWQGRIALIDFPQVVDLRTNPLAAAILRRDVARVCEYFTRQGVACDAAAIADELWLRYAPAEDDQQSDLQ